MTANESNSPPEADETPSQIEEAMGLIGGVELIRGQVLNASSKLGILDYLDTEPIPADEVATELDLNSEYTYRVLRALAAFEVLNEHDHRRFSLTDIGAYFQADHPQSLRDAVRYGVGQPRISAIQHLPTIIQEGESTGYECEFGCDLFEYTEQNPSFGQHFNGTQTLLSMTATRSVLEALDPYDFSETSTICDVGGGHGHLLSHLLDAHPHLKGVVLELPSVIAEEGQLWAPKLGVDDRCTYLEGDMFDDVPTADAYIMKYLLHNWSDDECVQILSNIDQASPDGGRVFVVERVLQEETPSVPAVYLDMIMMLETGGRERTKSEYATLFEQVGWEIDTVWETGGNVSVVEGVKT
jgi:hypothetical protein